MLRMSVVFFPIKIILVIQIFFNSFYLPYLSSKMWKLLLKCTWVKQYVTLERLTDMYSCVDFLKVIVLYFGKKQFVKIRSFTNFWFVLSWDWFVIRKLRIFNFYTVIQFPWISSTQLIELWRMKGSVDLVDTQWFWI